MAVDEEALRARYDEELPKYQRANRRLNELVKDLVEDLGERYKVRPGAVVVGQPKEFDRFVDKVRRKEAEGRIHSIDDCFIVIKDLARARIVCETLSDCNRVEELLRDRDGIYVDDLRTERYIPSPTGYRGVHLSVSVNAIVGGKEQAVECELQVHTALQAAWALLTHKDFYKGDEVPPLVADLMRDLSDLLHVGDKYADRLLRAIEEAKDA